MVLEHPARLGLLGEGAWGTAIAHLLATNGYDVLIWCHEQACADEINFKHTNSRYAPGISLPITLRATTSLKEIFEHSQIIFEAVPVQFLRTTLEQAKPFVQPNHHFVVLSKGIEAESLSLASQIITELYGNSTPITVLSGPSFSKDILAQQPTAVMLASQHQVWSHTIQKIVENNYLSTQISDDYLGVQACGAYKNVAALGIGIVEGAGYGANTQFLALMKSIEEMKLVVESFGGQPATAYSLAGIGDLTLTAFGGCSKNRKVGGLLGQGKRLDAILQETGIIPEGANTLVSLHKFSQKRGIGFPFSATIYGVVYEDKPASTLIDSLRR